MGDPVDSGHDGSFSSPATTGTGTGTSTSTKNHANEPEPGNEYVNPAKANTTVLQDMDPIKALSFPAKLHSMLSRKDVADVISWMPHGRSWRVHQPERFEMEVIPRFFANCKYSSFIRQANGWGFRRITKGPDRNSYYHKYFLRGRLQLCRHMKRLAPKEKEASHPELEPDLYKMSEEDPLPEDDPIYESQKTSRSDTMRECEELKHRGDVMHLKEAASMAAAAAGSAVESSMKSMKSPLSISSLDESLATLRGAAEQVQEVTNAILVLKSAEEQKQRSSNDGLRSSSGHLSNTYLPSLVRSSVRELGEESDARVRWLMALQQMDNEAFQRTLAPRESSTLRGPQSVELFPPSGLTAPSNAGASHLSYGTPLPQLYAGTVDPMTRFSSSRGMERHSIAHDASLFGLGAELAHRGVARFNASSSDDLRRGQRPPHRQDQL